MYNSPLTIHIWSPCLCNQTISFSHRSSHLCQPHLHQNSTLVVIVTVCIPRPRFHLHVFCIFFFLLAFVDFGGQILLLWTVYALFTHCAYTVHVLKNVKNGFHNTIYTFKNYFATVFSVFSFQFSTTISSI